MQALGFKFKLEQMWLVFVPVFSVIKVRSAQGKLLMSVERCQD